MNGIIIKANFEQDLKDYIKSNILSLGNKNNVQNLKQEFGINDNTYWNKTIIDILSDYYNFLDRVIFPLPKKVILTEDIISNSDYLKYESKINEIKTKFELGKSVNEYLSDKHKDMALHLLGLHHLHLADKLKNGKIDKDKNKPCYLLIIQVDEKNKIVYFLDILSHKDFDKFDYYKFAKILKKEGLINNKYVIEADKDTDSHNFSSAEYREVAKVINIHIELDDSVLIPRMIMANKGLTEAIYYAKRISIYLEYYENKYLNIIGIHNLLQQKNQHLVGIEKYEIKITWLSIDLLNGITVNLTGFQEEKI